MENEVKNKKFKRLDPSLLSPEVVDFQEKLKKKIIGQDRAIRQLVRAYQVFLAGMIPTGRPVANLLLLGPTGSGKTHLVEAMAEVLFNNPRAFLKIDCAEFQHSHEISKLIGSPPGYLGHKETPPMITQQALDQYHTDKLKLSLVLFDEIEKANDALWQLLLGVLDKASLTLGDNRRVDFSRAIILMTSNLGSKEVDKLVRGAIGFSSTEESSEEIDQKIYRTASAAARRKFSPEFMNRIDRIIVFRNLRHEHLEKILNIELDSVQERIIELVKNKIFVFHCTEEARKFLLEEGTDPKSGARHLKRAIERHLVAPLSNLITTNQITQGDIVIVDTDEGKLSFYLGPDKIVLSKPPASQDSYESEENKPIPGKHGKAAETEEDCDYTIEDKAEAAAKGEYNDEYC